jgi:hypothetical protein
MEARPTASLIGKQGSCHRLMPCLLSAASLAWRTRPNQSYVSAVSCRFLCSRTKRTARTAETGNPFVAGCSLGVCRPPAKTRASSIAAFVSHQFSLSLCRGKATLQRRPPARPVPSPTQASLMHRTRWRAAKPVLRIRARAP